jgi:hypothetical protein
MTRATIPLPVPVSPWSNSVGNSGLPTILKAAKRRMHFYFKTAYIGAADYGTLATLPARSRRPDHVCPHRREARLARGSHHGGVHRRRGDGGAGPGPAMQAKGLGGLLSPGGVAMAETR